ncbi:hypothetical protein FO519_010631 [Halicephalobus sp. NKZ332]|nr:hypothetical protein FO519_010631 [Halicephalobus sp. NKZ332]
MQKTQSSQIFHQHPQRTFVPIQYPRGIATPVHQPQNILTPIQLWNDAVSLLFTNPKTYKDYGLDSGFFHFGLMMRSMSKGDPFLRGQGYLRVCPNSLIHKVNPIFSPFKTGQAP